MGTLNNKGGQQRHDGQKNYQNSNQRNPDNVRNDTQKHEYKDHDEKLTNDANFDVDTQKAKIKMDFDDKLDNVSKNEKDSK